MAIRAPDGPNNEALVMMITVAPIRVSIAEDQSVVAVPSLTIPPPVLFRTKQMSNISYSRHRQNLDIFSPSFILGRYAENQNGNLRWHLP